MIGRVKGSRNDPFDYRTMITINLIPSEYIEKEKKKAVIILVSVSALIAVSAIGSFSFYKMRTLDVLSKKTIELEAKVKSLEAIAKEVDALEAKKKSIDARNSVVKQLLVGRFNYPMLME